MTYSLINKCAKNYYNRTFIVPVIAKNVVTCFFETQCTCLLSVRVKIKVVKISGRHAIITKYFSQACDKDSCILPTEEIVGAHNFNISLKRGFLVSYFAFLDDNNFLREENFQTIFRHSKI